MVGKDPAQDYQALLAAANRVAIRKERIEETRLHIAKGERWKAESPERRRLFERREAEIYIEESQSPRVPIRIAELGHERTIGLTRDFLSIEFLETGQTAARSVGRLSVPDTGELGTGFLIGENLLLTNNHVLEEPLFAESAEVEFNVEDNRVGPAKRIETFALDPARFFYTDRSHDMTVVAVKPHSRAGAPLGTFGFHPLISQIGKIRVGDPVMIIQHPRGAAKALVLHDSHLLALDDSPDADGDIFCWYSSDTEKGSSGAPVFNTRWEIVALHHRSVPRRTEDGQIADRDGNPIPKEDYATRQEDIDWISNEGIRASRVVRKLKNTAFEDPAFAAIRDRLLTLWKRPGIQEIAREAARTLPPASPIRSRARAPDNDTRGQPAATIPIHITLHLDPSPERSE